MGTYIHQIHYITSDDSKMSHTLSHTEAATLSLQTKRTRVNSVSSGLSFAIYLPRKTRQACAGDSSSTAQQGSTKRRERWGSTTSFQWDHWIAAKEISEFSQICFEKKRNIVFKCSKLIMVQYLILSVFFVFWKTTNGNAAINSMGSWRETQSVSNPFSFTK